jgi:hypothetical protein
MLPGYEQSSYSSDAVRGGPLPEDETEPNAESGIEPLPWTRHDEPLAEDWMGLDWSDPMALDDVHGRVPEAGGLYRLWRPGETLPLEYIGQSSNLKSRLYRHRRNREADLSVAYAMLPRADARHKREEVETELIGAHWLASEAVPRDQF